MKNDSGNDETLDLRKYNNSLIQIDGDNRFTLQIIDDSDS